jgi:hypothetical protein
MEIAVHRRYRLPHVARDILTLVNGLFTVFKEAEARAFFPGIFE